MKIAEILALRYEWEEIVRKHYVLPRGKKNGTTDNLKYFVRNGHKKNRFRDNFKRAIEIAKEITRESNDNTHRTGL